MIFVVMYGCESWTIKKAELRRIDAFELWCWRRLLRVPWTARKSNQSTERKSVLYIHWKEWCWSWNSNTLATWYEELTHWKRPWCWEKLKAGEEGDDRRWGSWMASPTGWTWVWASSGSWWWTGKPGVLQSMGSQRVGHNWATALNWTEKEVHSNVWEKVTTKNAASDLCVSVDQSFWLFVTSWMIACQAPVSMEFSRQEYSSGLSFLSPGDLNNPGIKLGSPALQEDS